MTPEGREALARMLGEKAESADFCLAVAFGMGLIFAVFSIASPWLGFLIGLLGCALVASLAFASIER